VQNIKFRFLKLANYKFGDFAWNIDGFHFTRFSYESGDRTGNNDPRSRRGQMNGTILGRTKKNHEQMLVMSARLPRPIA